MELSLINRLDQEGIDDDRHFDETLINKMRKKTCSVEGCTNSYHAKGYCDKHYRRVKKHGRPDTKSNCKHGYTKKGNHHPLYRVWSSMKQRCYDKKSHNYKYYGGCGISVCQEWLNPKTFIEWCLSNGWEKGLELDRKDNNGIYEPSNCRFITSKENKQNTRLIRSSNASGYRGVYWREQSKCWGACIRIKGKTKHLGFFKSARLAAIRYDVEAYLNYTKPRNIIL